jgi:hypothetical protein
MKTRLDGVSGDAGDPRNPLLVNGRGADPFDIADNWNE